MTRPEKGDKRIAVVIPCHNYGRFLEDALISVARQTLPPAEVVVVDDGSVDETGDVLATVRRRLPNLPLRVIRHELPMGVAAAMTAGIRATSAPYFAIVDADDTCEPRFLEALAAALEARDDAGFAYPRMRLVGTETGVYVTHHYDVRRLLFQGNYIPMVAMLRREAFESTRGYRQLRSHIDWDLWLSLGEAGWSGVLVDETLYNWRRHEGAMTHQPMSARLRIRLNILRTHWRLALRHLPYALPWTGSAIARYASLLLPGRRKVHRTASGWVEGGDLKQ